MRRSLLVVTVLAGLALAPALARAQSMNLAPGFYELPKEATVAVIAQDTVDAILPLLADTPLRTVVVVTYAAYLPADEAVMAVTTDAPVPEDLVAQIVGLDDFRSGRVVDL